MELLEVSSQEKGKVLDQLGDAHDDNGDDDDDVVGNGDDYSMLAMNRMMITFGS